jgi:hypothetical protein
MDTLKERKPNGYWTVERLNEEMAKYPTKRALELGNLGACKAARTKGILNDFYTGTGYKPQGYWTPELIQVEALKYDSLSSFQNGSKRAYSVALKAGTLKDYCSHMTPKGSIFKRVVYIAEFADKSVYIGLTCNFVNRMNTHLISEISQVFKHIVITGLNPTFSLYNKGEFYSGKEAGEIECNLIQEYKDNGFNVLNIAKGGSLGGKFTYWTDEVITEEALKYNSKNELSKGNPKAYKAAYRKGLLNTFYSN